MPFNEEVEHIDKVIQRNLNYFSHLKYKKKTKLAFEDKKQSDILYISSGVISMHLSRGKQEALVGVLIRGEVGSVIPRMAMYQNLVFRALTPANVYVCNYEKLTKEIGEIVTKQMFTGAVLSVQNALFRQAELMHIRDTKDRIIRFMSGLRGVMYPDAPTGAFAMDWDLKQGELAEILGVTRPYLNMMLRELVEEGIIKFSDGSVHVNALKKRTS